MGTPDLAELVRPCTPQEKRAAARTVAVLARDRHDCLLMLDMLGLLEDEVARRARD